jgi:hypothetical protein
MRILRVGALGDLAILLGFSRAHPAIQLEPVLVGLSSPLYLTHARDGTNRLFVVEHEALGAVTRLGIRAGLWGTRLLETPPGWLLILVPVMAAGGGLLGYGAVRRWRS